MQRLSEASFTGELAEIETLLSRANNPKSSKRVQDLAVLIARRTQGETSHLAMKLMAASLGGQGVDVALVNLKRALGMLQ